jgi:hypothetical protein
MFSRLTIALFSLLLIQACAQTQQAREVQSSGFLGTDYARLKEGNEGEALLVYKNANVNLAKYDKIHLDPVTIWMSGKSAFEGISAEDRQRLADDFYNALHKELSQDYRLVDQLGPGVMRIQVALTDAKGSSPVMDTISTVMPIGLAISQNEGPYHWKTLIRRRNTSGSQGNRRHERSTACRRHRSPRGRQVGLGNNGFLG